MARRVLRGHARSIRLSLLHFILQLNSIRDERRMRRSKEVSREHHHNRALRRADLRSVK
jgi:hypothetical protein